MKFRRRAFRSLAWSVLLAGTLLTVVPAGLDASTCTSGDGGSSCSCAGRRCWAGATTCGCLPPDY